MNLSIVSAKYVAPLKVELHFSDGTAFNDYSYALQRHGDNRFFCKHFYEILVKNDFILYFLKFSMKYLFRQKNICIFVGDM